LIGGFLTQLRQRPEHNNLIQPIMTTSSTQHKPRYFERVIQSGQMPSIPACRQIPINTQGTDYVVGDIHGHYDKLMDALLAVNFDRKCDRLLAVGDLVDRGPDSLGVIELLNEPWFFSCMGNHEDLLWRHYCCNERQAHVANGGSWFASLAVQAQAQVVSLITSTMSLSLETQVLSNNQLKTIGLIHAAAPATWISLSNLSIDAYLTHLWDRRQYHHVIDGTTPHQHCEGIDAVVMGHVSCQSVVRSGGNLVWIDTLYRGGELSLLPLRDIVS
jgi:serine/threonine protein phosphatase 1